MSLEYGMSFYFHQDEAIPRNDLICLTGRKRIFLIKSEHSVLQGQQTGLCLEREGKAILALCNVYYDIHR